MKTFEKATNSPMLIEKTIAYSKLIAEQMKTPIQHKLPWNITQFFLARRTGLLNSIEIDDCSLNRILFVSENNDVSPLPFSKMNFDFEFEDLEKYLYDLVFRWVVLQLLKNGFTLNDMENLRILTEIVILDIRNAAFTLIQK
jgi:hypothetical protein